MITLEKGFTFRSFFKTVHKYPLLQTLNFYGPYFTNMFAKIKNKKPSDKKALDYCELFMTYRPEEISVDDDKYFDAMETFATLNGKCDDDDGIYRIDISEFLMELLDVSITISKGEFHYNDYTTTLPAIITLNNFVFGAFYEMARWDESKEKENYKKQFAVCHVGVLKDVGDTAKGIELG